MVDWNDVEEANCSHNSAENECFRIPVNDLKQGINEANGR